MDIEKKLTMSFGSISHLFKRSNSTIFSCPSKTAKCNGVRSTFVLASLLIPALKSTSQVSK